MHDYRDDGHPQDQKDDAEDETCPICIEPFDTEDQRFIACPCNYRVCMFCVRRLRTEFDGRCPGCRRDYNEANFRFLNLEDRFSRGKKQAQSRINNGSENSGSNSFHSSTGRGQRSSEKYHHRRTGSNTGSGAASSGKYDYSEESFVYGETGEDGTTSQNARVNLKDLSNVRVVQDNLVYLIGLAPSIAREEVLRSNRFFGQYGRIIKVVVSRNSSSDSRSAHGYNQNHGRSTSSSAYITFSRAEDAKAAIQAVNGFWIDNHMIRASYGTTKYCNMFLRQLPCNNPECLYLHKLGDESSSFTKEQMQQAGRSFQEAPQTVMEPPGLNGRDENTCLPTRGLTVSDYMQNSQPEGAHSSHVSRPTDTSSKHHSDEINSTGHNGLSTTSTSSGRGLTNAWGNKSRVSSLASSSSPGQNGTTGWPTASPSSVVRSSEGSSELEKSRSSTGPVLESTQPPPKSRSAHQSLPTHSNHSTQRQSRSTIVYDSLSQESKEPVRRLDAEEKEASQPTSQSLLSTLGGIELSAYNKQHQIPENRKLRTISPIGHPIHAELRHTEETESNTSVMSKSLRQTDARLYGLRERNTAAGEDDWTHVPSSAQRMSRNDSSMEFNMSSLLRPVEGQQSVDDGLGLNRQASHRRGRLWEGSGETAKPNNSYSNAHAHTSSLVNDGQTAHDMGRFQQQPKFHILSNVHRGKGTQQRPAEHALLSQNSRNRYANGNVFVDKAGRAGTGNSSLLAGHSFNIQKN